MKVPAWKKTGGWGRARFLALLFLLACPGTAAPLTLSGSVITHDFTARYATPVLSDMRSNQTRVSINDVADPVLIPPRNATTKAGVPADFLHTLSNRGNFADSFRLRASLAEGAHPDTGQVPQFRFYTADGLTPLPTDADGVQVIGPLAPGVPSTSCSGPPPFPGARGGSPSST